MSVEPWAVVLAGGLGSRFWPVSTPTRPKQLLPLVSHQPLLCDALDRLAPMIPPERTMVLTNASLRDAVVALAPSIPTDQIIAEPRPAGSAAALAWAARVIERRAGSDTVMISVHADWAIRDDATFRRVLRDAAAVARDRHALVTVGIVPDRPDPGFGYIQPATQEPDGSARVARFVEKPDRAGAERMCAEGYLWNSGIFVWRVCDFLEELHRHTPEVAPALDAAGEDLEAFFRDAKSLTVDVGVLERSDRVRVLRGDFGWNDVGTWAALRRVRTVDAGGNAASGSVHAVQSRDNVIVAEDTTVVAYGVDSLVVIARPGLTLVTTVERAGELKTLLDALPADVRELA